MRILARRLLLFLAAPVCFGLFVFHYYYGLSFANPSYISWMVGNCDFVTWLLGWQFLRQEPWQWPPGKFIGYGFPHGGSVALTGSLPLVAIPLKFFGHHLPVDFQYFGAWMALSYALQACAGAMLTRLVTKNAFAIAAGSILFVSVPVLVMQQMCGSTGSHWLILFALWLYLVRDLDWISLRSTLIMSVVLNLMAILIFPYLAAMVFAISCALYVRLGVLQKTLTYRQMVSLVAGVAAADVFFLYLAGGFVISVKNFPNARGLEWPLALNGLFSSGGFSRFSFMGHYSPMYGGEHYMYLGSGIVLLSLIGVAVSFWKSHKRVPSVNQPAYDRAYFWPLMVVCSLFSLYALSNNVYLDCDHKLFSFPLPDLFVKVVSPFRECARFFWPCYYMIIFLAITAIVKNVNTHLAALLLCLAAGLQLCEFKGIPGQAKWNSPLHGQLLTGLVGGGGIRYESPLKDPVWNHCRDYKGIMVYPNSFKVKADADFFYFDYLAANNGLYVTGAYLARLDDAQEQYLQRSYDQISKGHLNDSLIYVVTDASRDKALPFFATEGVCGIVDQYTICVKNSDTSFCRVLKSRKA